MDTVSGASSMLETSRDLTLDAVSAAAARTFGGVGTGSSTPRELSTSQIRKLLESRFDQEIHDGLRKTINGDLRQLTVLQMMYRGQPCLPLFSAVIKNVASPNVEIKKLVYIYLLRHAEQEPDLALLSINTIQKSLSDQNPQVRAMALRVMSGIRVPIISQIVSLAIKKGTGDMSAIVRKTAALAIPKCYRLDPTTEPQLVEYITTLLGDKQYYVVGAAITALLDVCPSRLDLLHKHYRGLVKKLVDMEDWGQLALIKALTVYARNCFPDPTAGGEKKDKQKEGTARGDNSGAMDSDLKLFLDACRSLTKNRNPAVILAIARAFVYVGTDSYLKDILPSLIALLRGPRDTHGIVFYNIVSICMDKPALLAPYIDHFWIRDIDDSATRQLKMEILTLIFPGSDETTRGIILNELEHFTQSSACEAPLVREAVQAIGRCAQQSGDEGTVAWCMDLLLHLASGSSPDAPRDDNSDVLVGEALTVVRRLIQQNPDEHRGTIVQLAKNLDTIYNEQARATVIWLIGEYAAGDNEDMSVAPDVLRILIQGFADEDTTVKSQIVLLAAKVYLHHRNRVVQAKDSSNQSDNQASQNRAQSNGTGESEHSAEASYSTQVEGDEQAEQAEQAEQDDHPIAKLWEYTQLLVRYDVSYELRDRIRLYHNLLSDPTNLPLANLVLLAPKPVPAILSPSEARKNLNIGSATLIVGPDAGSAGLSGYTELPDWAAPQDRPDPSVRDVEGSAATAGGRGGGSRGGDGTSQPGAGTSMSGSAVDWEQGAETKPKKTKAPTKSLDDWLDEESEGETTAVAAMRTGSTRTGTGARQGLGKGKRKEEQQQQQDDEESSSEEDSEDEEEDDDDDDGDDDEEEEEDDDDDDEDEEDNEGSSDEEDEDEEEEESTEEEEEEEKDVKLAERQKML